MKKRLLALFLVVATLLSACTVSESQVEEYVGEYYKNDDYAKGMLDYGHEILSSDEEAVIAECTRLVKKLKKSPDAKTANEVAFKLAIISAKTYTNTATGDEVERCSKEALSFLQKETQITMDAVPWWAINRYRSVRDLFQQGKFSGKSAGISDWLIAIGRIWGN